MLNESSPGYTPNEQGNGYEINPGEAAEVRKMFKQVGTKGVAMYMPVNGPSKAEPAKRAAIYARSATRSGEVEGLSSLDQQIAEGRQHCNERCYLLDEQQHIYQEIIGGMPNGNRSYLPQLDTMRRAAKQHQFDILVIRSLDRLARDIQFQTIILHELTQAGVKVECTNGPDLDDDHTKLIEAVIEQAAQAERQQIIKRMQLGKAARKAQREQQ